MAAHPRATCYFITHHGPRCSGQAPWFLRASCKAAARTGQRLLRATASRPYSFPASCRGLPRYEAFVREELAHLRHRGILLRHDEAGRLERVRLGRLAYLPEPGQQLCQRRAEDGLVVVLDRLLQLGIQSVQLGGSGLRHLQLTLAEDADDHSTSPVCSAACAAAGSAFDAPVCAPSICRGALLARAAFICSSSLSTPLLAPSRSSSTWMSSRGPPTMSSSAPEAISSSIAPALAFICSVLSSARWIAIPTSPISSEMPVKASLILVCASAAV